MNATDLSCPSRIICATVYARGAVVTRRVDLPKDLPAQACELKVPGLPALAKPGSLRAEVAGGREVVALRSRLLLPEEAPQPEGHHALLRELDLRSHRLTLEQEHLQERRGVFLTLEPRLRGLRRAGIDPASRARDALAVNALVTDLSSGIDARLRELADGLRELEREREAIELERSQVGVTAGQPTREVGVRIGPGASDSLEALRIHYVVPAARWWPAYAARLTEGGTRAEWSLEAFVAQTSGESWDGVELSLSTADLISDARLPELASLRLGRRQAERSSGFRPPPEGLDALFQGYDRDQTRFGPRTEPSPPPPSSGLGAKKPKPQPRPARVPEPVEIVTDAPVVPSPDSAWLEVEDRPKSGKRRRSISFGAAPATAPLNAAPEMAPGADRASGKGGGGHREQDRLQAPDPAGAPIEPADAWLDFDSLVLGTAHDRVHRGRLARVIEAAVADLQAAAEAALAAVGTPAGASDPLAGRGQFDHQYRAAGQVDVGSRREAQRIALSSCDADCRPLLRIAPAVEQVAYREVELSNPFPGPLLAGPVDVFLEGSLLTTSVISKVGRGGRLQLGLGAEDRVRVARNARVSESTAGLIGKTTAVEHEVTIELASSLPHPVQVRVVDRVPVTDDDDVTVELVRATPEGAPYDQRDRDAPVRGGRQWTIELAAGGEARIEFVYRVSFPSRRELVGGNRRD